MSERIQTQANPEAYVPELPPAAEFPDHHLTAAFVKEHEIVSVDEFDRGHRPTWTTSEGKKSGGEYLSYYEMDQIAANRDQIVNDPQKRAEEPSPGDDPDPILPPSPPAPPGPGEVPADPGEPDPAPGGGGRGRGPRFPRRTRGGSDGGDGRSDDGYPDRLDPRSSAHERIRIRREMPAHERIKLARRDKKRAEEIAKFDKAYSTVSDSPFPRGRLRDMDVKDIAELTKRVERQARTSTHKEMIRTMEPEDYDRIEVLEKVPWLDNKLLKSIWFSRFARRRFREQSFTLLEYHSGVGPARRADRNTSYSRRRGSLPDVREAGDRRHDRFYVKEVKKGIIAPHVINAEDRSHKWLPDARKTTRPERRRRDTLTVARSGATWAAGLHSQGREAIGVGADRALSVIGFDARTVTPRSRGEYWRLGILDSFGINRKLTPNAAADARERLSAGQEIDLVNKLRARTRHDRHVRLRLPGRAPVAPPHPHDRRTPRWQGWGQIAWRRMDDGPRHENDRKRLTRPNRYRT